MKHDQARKFLISPFVFAVIILLSTISTFASEKDPLQVSLQSAPFEWQEGQNGQIVLKLDLPAGFHAYQDSIKLKITEPEGFIVSTPQINPLSEWYDKFSKKNRRGFTDRAHLTAQIEAPKFFNNGLISELKLALSYQACSEQFCLFPVTKTIVVPIKIKSNAPSIVSPPVPEANSEIKQDLLSQQNINSYLKSNLFIGLFFVFIAGILTSFTPCIFPMIPITLAVLGNHSEQRTRGQNFLMSLFYVHGIATTYSILGLIAASSGSIFGASLGNPYVLSFVCVLFLMMSLSMYGLFEIQVPAVIRNKFGAGKSKGGLGGAYLTGLFAGIVASPCVGPVLVSILTFVATSQSKFLGFLYLFTYAMGLGMIFLVLGLSNQMIRLLPRSGMWMNAFKFFLGTLMLSAFYYYLNLLIPEKWFDTLLGVGLVVISSVYGAFHNVKNKSKIHQLQKGLMQAALFIGFAYLTIGIFDLRPFIQQRFQSEASINKIKNLNWKNYSPAEVELAEKNNMPVIIDFWAEWCAACHELEENTFSSEKVKFLAENFTLLKFDATADSEMLKQLKNKYQIQGLPTVIFIDRKGQWQRNLTLTEFEKPEKFTKRMQSLLN